MIKRASWPWHRTRMCAPDRAARLWLAVAVATLWLLSVGEVADARIPVSTLLDVTEMCPERRHPSSDTPYARVGPRGCPPAPNWQRCEIVQTG